MTPAPEPIDDQRLEDLCAAYLKAAEETPGLAGDDWLESNAPLEYQQALREVLLADACALPRQESLFPGQLIGADFELVREIGAGGFGWAWEARQLSLDRTVALKVLRRDLLTPASVDESFEREARNLAALRHPGIVDIHTVGRDGELFYLAMELVEGVTLADVLRAASGSVAAPEPARRLAQDWKLGSPAGDRRAVVFLERLCQAVQAMHRLGIHHRDLKPQNVLVERNGQPRIIDFGLSILALEAGLEEGQGELLGTLEYLPPESLRRGSSGHPVTTDLWALASMFYELLTLSRPYGQGTRSEIRERGSSGRIEDPAALRRDLSPELRAVCMRALNPDPELRYADVSSFADDLGRLRRHIPVSTSRASSLKRTLMWVRRHRTVTLFAALLLMLLVSWLALLRGDSVVAIEFEMLAPAQRQLSSSPDPYLDEMVREPARGRLYGAGDSLEGAVSMGSWMFLRLTTDEPAWLYVLSHNDSDVNLLFPRQDLESRPGESFAFEQRDGHPAHFFSATQDLRLPLGSVTGRPGRETILVVATRVRSATMEALGRRLLMGSNSSPIESAARVDLAFRGLAREQTRELNLPRRRPAKADSERDELRPDDWIWNQPVEELRVLLGEWTWRWEFTSREAD